MAKDRYRTLSRDMTTAMGWRAYQERSARANERTALRSFGDSPPNEIEKSIGGIALPLDSPATYAALRPSSTSVSRTEVDLDHLGR